MMVRARRVRAVVACARNDECCSPNPKRKDQGAVKSNLSYNVNKTITHFFNVVKNDDISTVTMIGNENDLDDVDKEEFKVLPDLELDDYKDEKLLPTTPHRIQLRDDSKDGKADFQEALKDIKDQNNDEAESIVLYGKMTLQPIICEEVPLTEEFIVKLEDEENLEEKVVQEELKSEQPIIVTDTPIAPKVQDNGKTSGAPKARRRLNNNQSSNQQEQVLKAPPAKTDVDNKQNHKLTDYFPVRRSVRKTKKTVLEEKQRTLEQTLRLGREEGLEVHNFTGKGRGIVAVRSFNRGDFVVEYAGDLIDMQQARRRELKYAQDQNTGCYMYYFKHKNTQYCIDATAETGRLGRLVNHSRNGNLNTRVIDVDGIPRLVLVAKETIQIGDEITYDYGDRSKESLKHHPWLAY